MTEYGRGPGSEPWHPEDPLYGDYGWTAEQESPYAPQQGASGQYPYDGQLPTDGQLPYDGQPQYHPQQAPRQPQPQEYDAWATGQQQIYDAGPGPGQLYPDPLEQPLHGHPGQAYPGAGQQPYAARPPLSDPSARTGHPSQGYPDESSLGGQPHAPYPDHGQDTGYVQQYGAWDTGQHAQPPYGPGSADPYGQQPRGHHGDEPGYPGAPGGMPGDPAHGTAVPGAYAHPGQPTPHPGQPAPHPGQPAARRRPQQPEPEPEPPTDWDPGPDQGEHAFFAGGDDGDDGDLDESGGRRGRGSRRGRGGTGRQRRGGCACLTVSLLLTGVVGGVGYFGYQFYENHFGPPPDFAGDATGRTVTVEVPEGATGYVMGQLLKEKGVVKSVDAFVEAQKNNPRGQTIQDGFYTLHQQMSAEDAVALMLDPKSRNNLIIAEGWRNSLVYAQIDSRLGLKAGTTRSIAQKHWKKLGLPDWAMSHQDVKDPLEGFLYPSSYPVGKGMKPEDVLKKMVTTATEKYDALHLEAQADKLHVDGPWQLITIASLVQAEGKTHDDFRKMSEVVYNRLKPTNTETNQLLQFDSTFNYLKGQSKINISESEINSNRDPYNTYTRRGLTPGPIGNPGAEALAAALNPTHSGWIYFVATDGMNKTEFAKTYASFKKLKDKFNDSGRN